VSTAVPALRYSVDETGALLAWPQGARRCVALAMRPDAAEIRGEGSPPVRLEWSENGVIHWAIDETARDRWQIAGWTQGRGGPFGIALRVSGHIESASHALIDATRRSWRRFSIGNDEYLSGGSLLPIVPSISSFNSCWRERSTLSALTTVLRDRADLRHRLGDAQRVYRLAADLMSGPLGLRAERTGIRRDTVDIYTAMRHAGFFHRFGRPLSRASLPNIDDVIVATRKRLDANPYRVGRHTPDEVIRKTAQKIYYDVEPWPFAALVD